MKRIIITLIIGVNYLLGQVYYHPTTGVQNTFSGGCQVHTCSGMYYDDGGPTGDYSNNINSIYWTFCPDQVGQCISMDFYWIDIEDSWLWGCYDWLYIKDGPTQNSPDLFAGCGTGNLGVYTANNPSGCLTIRFYSDGSINWEGWEAAISCVPCAVAANNGGNSDCENPVTVCSNANISDISNGPGINSTCGGCITNENYTNFYVFRPQFTGTMGLVIDPNDPNDDFDFAIWGPFSGAPNCAALGTPLRCSYAATTGPTGTSNTATDVSEDVNGDGWVSDFNVTANQYYLLLINGWTPNSGSNGYLLSWQLPPGGTLDCTPLSIPVSSFNAVAKDNHISLNVVIEPQELKQLNIYKKSFDTNEWELLHSFTISDKEQKQFFLSDNSPYKGLNEYKLTYTDNTGKEYEYPRVRSVNWNPAKQHIVAYKTLFKNDLLQIVFTSVPSHSFDVIMLDINGKNVFQQTVSPTSKERTIEIPLQNLPKGLYTLIINGKTSKILLE